MLLIEKELIMRYELAGNSSNITIITWREILNFVLAVAPNNDTSRVTMKKHVSMSLKTRYSWRRWSASWEMNSTNENRNKHIMLPCYVNFSTCSVIIWFYRLIYWWGGVRSCYWSHQSLFTEYFKYLAIINILNLSLLRATFQCFKFFSILLITQWLDIFTSLSGTQTALS